MEIDLRKLEFDKYEMDYTVSTIDDVLFKQKEYPAYKVRVSLADSGQKEEETKYYDYVVITYLDNNRVSKQVVYDIKDFEYETHDGEKVINEYFDYKLLKKCVEDYLWYAA